MLGPRSRGHPNHPVRRTRTSANGSARRTAHAPRGRRATGITRQ
ncbi:hypothetical protein KPATCC21470_5066 [Kitasatospora purpeofusca]